MQFINKKYRFICVLLAILIFLTSSGVHMDMHFCNGQLKTVSLLGEAQNCHDIKKGKTCPHHQQSKQQNTAVDTEKTTDCCENRTVVFQVDTDKDFEVAVQSSVAHEFSSFSMPMSVLAHSSFPALVLQNIDPVYSMPVIPRDIYVLLETFLL